MQIPSIPSSTLAGPVQLGSILPTVLVLGRISLFISEEIETQFQ